MIKFAALFLTTTRFVAFIVSVIRVVKGVTSLRALVTAVQTDVTWHRALGLLSFTARHVDSMPAAG